VQKIQRLPHEQMKDMKKLYKKRREDIAQFEAYAYRNGIRIVKFMLHVSEDEQKSASSSASTRPQRIGNSTPPTWPNASTGTNT